MKSIKRYKKDFAVFWVTFSIVMILSSVCFSRTLTQFTPSLTISEEYNDNYLREADNEQEEFITSYELGFSLGFLKPKSQIYLGYSPRYVDHKNFDNRGGLEHNVSLDGFFTPNKKTNIDVNLAYTSEDDQETGDSWENSADLSGSYQLSKHTSIRASHSYTQEFDQQIRTGEFIESEQNITEVAISNRFGERDRAGLSFRYSFEDYEDTDADENTEFSPTAYITYWLTPLNGIDSNFSYEKTDFENSNDDIESYSGHIRYLRKLTKRFDGFVRYRHLYTERESGNHHVFHPSAGFDWDVTDDSGISLGIGVLINEWDNENNDSIDPFLDLNAYKIYDFSKRGSLSITGSSGYDATNEDSESLGFSLYYRTGFRLSYQLQKRISSNLFGSFERNEFREDAVNRTDNTIRLGAGLNWSPLKWLRLALSYSYTDFNTDGELRGDYTENKGTFSVSFIPVNPVRLDSLPSRQRLENELF